MDKRVIFGAIALAATLAACGGGGGGSTGGGILPSSNPSATPTVTPTVTPGTTTNASGVVVDDGTGAPLAGQKVVLEPWVAGATPLPSPQATTAADGTFTLNAAPNGHYLLVIGNDTPGQTTTAVVHDNVTLTGGNQTLKAPTLPTIPGYSAPTWETNGDYRIATLNATTEVPCFSAWNTDRANAGVGAAVPDEWLQENVRAEWAYQNVGNFSIPLPINSGFLSYYGSNAGGGGTCQTAFIDPTFAGSLGATAQTAAISAHVTWFAGVWKQVTSGGAALYGYGEYPYDPRFQADPNGNWP